MFNQLVVSCHRCGAGSRGPLQKPFSETWLWAETGTGHRPMAFLVSMLSPGGHFCHAGRLPLHLPFQAHSSVLSQITSLTMFPYKRSFVQSLKFLENRSQIVFMAEWH